MFNFKKIFFREKTPKKYMSCHWAEHGINFHVNNIRTCCMLFHKGGGVLPTMGHEKGDFNYKKFFKKKSAHRKLHRNGKIHPKCLGCLNLEEKTWDEKNYINRINLDTFTRCNSNCIYCFCAQNKEKNDAKPPYKILNDIKMLIDKKVLIPGGEVMFGGGEPTINEEFEALVTLFLDKGFDYIKVHSSGIKYSLAIERCIKEGKADLIISPDAGEIKLYEKIKRTQSFDLVWNNLQKYSEAQTNNKTQVKAKYIIIPGINDTTENIDNFYKKVLECSINSVRFDIEVEWYTKNRNDDEKIIPYFHLLKYAEQKAKHIGLMQFFFQAQAQTAINEHPELFESIR